MDVILALGGGERLQEVGTGVPVPIGVSLEKDSTGCILRSVGGNSEGGR